jgi:hypothetical protein
MSPNTQHGMRDYFVVVSTFTYCLSENKLKATEEN